VNKKKKEFISIYNQESTDKDELKKTIAQLNKVSTSSKQEKEETTRQLS